MSDQRPSGGKPRQRSPAELRAEIEATRARLAGDIDAARDKLSRRNLRREALGAVRGARGEASGTLGDWSTTADQQVGQLSKIAVDTIKRYPVITTLLGLGLALVAFSNGRRSSEKTSGEHEAEPDLPVVRSTAKADLPPPRS